MTPRLPILLPLMLVLSACQLLGPRDELAVDDEPELPADIQESLSDRLALTIEYLQDGEVDRAEELLSKVLTNHPDNRLASRLMIQIREDPEALLGDRYEHVVVEPGDTLSQLAARHAGDGMLFFALARLNDIDRPRLLQQGALLRVPVLEFEEALAGEGVEAEAGLLLERGDAEKALEVLLAASAGRQLNDVERQLLARTAVMVSDRHLEAGQFQEAVATLDQAEPYLHAEDDRLAAQRDHVATQASLSWAESAVDAENREEAREFLRKALDLDPSQAIVIERLEEIEAALVEDFHDRALKAWREQEVEAAIDYWERVLEIDPAFAPAQIYLERGREVLRRLEEL